MASTLGLGMYAVINVGITNEMGLELMACWYETEMKQLHQKSGIAEVFTRNPYLCTKGSYFFHSPMR